MIRFGTDGWRDLIAENFTFDNVALAAQAYAEYLKLIGGRKVVVGFDTRFMADRFARKTAEVLAANGLEVHLSRAFLPTPALSFAVTHFQADGGVMITASHNPKEYCGFKLKGPYGGSLIPERVKQVEVFLGTAAQEFDAAKHTIETFDIQSAYYDHLKNLLDLSVLKSFEGTFYHDSMGGSGTGWVSGFLEHVGIEIDVRNVREEASPTFYGVHPEPILHNLHHTSDLLRDASGLAFAAVTDGDADRIGAVTAGGLFFNPHQIFAVLLKHLYDRGLRGTVVQTVSVSGVIERLCHLLALPVITTPIGFKYIAEEMLQSKILIGGEESGGIGILGHLPERDGILNALLMLEAVALSGKSLPELFHEIELMTGYQHAYDRLDLTLKSMTERNEAMARVQEPFPIAGHEVVSVDRRDGIKWLLSGNAWVMFRASGTEPVLRIYAEAANAEHVHCLLSLAHMHVTGVESNLKGCPEVIEKPEAALGETA